MPTLSIDNYGMENIDNRDAQIESVTIFGREYSLRSQESAEYTQKISAFVDRKMAEIADQLNTGEATKVAIMAALDIAFSMSSNILPN